MGCVHSSGESRPFDGVRVIHINGYVEDFEGPVTVGRVTGGKPATPRYVLCSSAHLLQPGRGPSRPEEPLEPGRVYFLLPHSMFESEASALDLACLMNRLTALARKAGPGKPGPSPSPSPTEPLLGGTEPKLPVGLGPCRSTRPGPWKPQLDRIDESLGRDSVRSSCSSSLYGET